MAVAIKPGSPRDRAEKIHKHRQAQLRGKRAQASGVRGENAVENMLIYLGFKFIRNIGTPFTVTSHKGNRITGGFFGEPVSGDFTALGPNAVSVLVEVKRREADKLSLSDFEPHQLKSLSDHWKLGGISLVAWVTPEPAVYVMGWPLPLVKGKPMTRETAATLHQATVDHFRKNLQS